MLGSHFDLAKEVAAIAARRDTGARRPEESSEEANKAFADFDKKVRDFVELIAPMAPTNGSRPITNPYLDQD